MRLFAVNVHCKIAMHVILHRLMCLWSLMYGSGFQVDPNINKILFSMCRSLKRSTLWAKLKIGFHLNYLVRSDYVFVQMVFIVRKKISMT